MILLDIDGVLNPFLGTGFIDKGYLPLRTQYHTALLPPNGAEIISRLQQLDEVMWVSAWQEDSNEVMDLYGLPHLKWISFAHQAVFNRFSSPKLAAVEHFYTVHRPKKFVWIEDEIDNEITDWMSDIGLLVVPDPSVGLTDEHMEEISGYYGCLQ